MSESDLGSALIALVLAFGALFAGLYINPIAEYTYSSIEYDVEATENNEQQSVSVKIENIPNQYKSVTVAVGSSTQTVIQPRNLTFSEISEGTKVKLTAERKGQSSIYSKNKVLYDKPVSYE